MNTYSASPDRYSLMEYRRCGSSGLLLPAISFGLWQNFGEPDPLVKMKSIIFQAFDLGITHFDLANNYGPPPGTAEINFGRILNEELNQYRDELIISSKAGWPMWPGPYGDHGSKKYLVASIDKSLLRMGLDYVDIFYHHRPDPETPMEETMAALDLIVRQGKALYVGISSYSADETRKAAAILKQLGTPCLINQPKYSMLDRWVENGLLDAVEETGMGCISFSSLAQGLLTNKYLEGIPPGSRASRPLGNGAIEPDQITPENISRVKQLDKLAAERGQSLAQMAIAWVLKDPRMTSVIIGASKPEQVADAVACLENNNFTQEDLAAIESILAS